MTLTKILSLNVLFLFISTTLWANHPVHPSDSQITSEVRNKITSDKSLSGTSIDITSSQGMVKISGNVDSETQADTAIELAQSIPGVKDVDAANLTIKNSQHPMNDALITAKIKGLFMQQKLFGGKDIAAITISVETNDAVVSLSGTADNQEQASTAVKIAKSVDGVKDVKSTIKITK